MSTPTPRTDKARYRAGSGWSVPLHFAEQLERELAAVTADREAIKQTLRKLVACAKKAQDAKDEFKTVQQLIKIHLK